MIDHSRMDDLNASHDDQLWLCQQGWYYRSATAFTYPAFSPGFDASVPIRGYIERTRAGWMWSLRRGVVNPVFDNPVLAHQWAVMNDWRDLV